MDAIFNSTEKGIRLVSILGSSILVLLILPATLVESSRETSLTIVVDKSGYGTGEIINISGTLAPLVAGEYVVIQVYNPLNTLARIDPVLPDASGSYFYNYTLDGPLNSHSGQYKVVAAYLGRTSEATFDFVAADDWDVHPLEINDINYDIRYKIDGGTLQTITTDPELATITFGVITDADGSIALQIPYGVHSSLGISREIEWIVFADSIPVSVHHDIDQCASTVTIPFEEGTEEIEIVGSWIPAYPDPETESGAKPSAVIYDSTAEFRAEGEEFSLPIRLDALDCSISFMQEENRIHAQVKGPDGEPGYFAITIPHRFLGGNYTILLNDEPFTAFNATYNQGVGGLDSTTISLEYDSNSVSSIDIVGASAIPEFGAIYVIVASAFGTIAAVASLRYRRL